MNEKFLVVQCVKAFSDDDYYIEFPLAVFNTDKEAEEYLKNINWYNSDIEIRRIENRNYPHSAFCSFKFSNHGNIKDYTTSYHDLYNTEIKKLYKYKDCSYTYCKPSHTNFRIIQVVFVTKENETKEQFEERVDKTASVYANEIYKEVQW